MRVLSAFCLVAAMAASLSAQQTLVIPSAAAAADGNSSTTWPLDLAAGRFLYIYDSSHFTNNGVTSPIVISQIRFRANASTTTWAGSSGTMQMDLSTAVSDYTAISTTWNTNHGSDRMTVYNGAFSVPAGSATAGVPGPFYVTFNLNTPFLYNPALGDLVIDTIHSGLTVANTPTLDAVTTAGVALAKRVYSTVNPPAATATLWSGDIANVLEFTFVPAGGLNSAFSVSTTGGPSPLSVTFTDQSSTSATGGITSWSWDFNGDGVADSFQQNPTYVYTTCGTYNVSLTVTDGTNPPATTTRTGLISTDQTSANFITTILGPLTVQFTDTSTMPSTSWAWDLNGDGITDSTAQSPVWVYPNTNPVNVTLNATRHCVTSTVTKPVIAAQQLSTNLAANNGGSTLWTVYFDLQVLNPLGITITALDSIASTLSTPFTIDVYMKQGTYSGFEFVPSAWTQVALSSGTTNAVANAPSLSTFAAPWHIPAGNYGIAFRYTGISHRYMTGAFTYGNGDVSLTGGSVGVTTGGPFATGTLNSPRTWSGTIYYGTHNISGGAGYGFFGPGCAGSAGVSHLTGTQPIVGQTLSVTANALPSPLAIMLTGFSNTFSASGPLPLDLSILGAPGCSARVSPDVTSLIFGAGGSAIFNLPIPNNSSYSGFVLYNQCFVLDSGFNALGAVLSDGAGMVIGY